MNVCPTNNRSESFPEHLPKIKFKYKYRNNESVQVSENLKELYTSSKSENSVFHKKNNNRTTDFPQ